MFLQQPQQQLHSISTTKTLNGNSTIGNNNSDGESGSNIDYTNLYIKNLDLDVKSRDLFKYFRDYGHIVSARVMRNPETDKSKGFGFVSFSRAEEAHWALREMNNKYILSKPIIVAFHEPKKPRTEKNGRSHDMVRRFSTPGIPPHPPPPYMPVAPSISEYIDYSKPSPQSGFPSRRPPITTHGTAPAAISMVNENFSNGKKRHSTMTHIPTISTPATQHNTNAFTPSPPLVSSLQKQQQRPQPQPQQPQLQLTPPPQQPQYHHHTNPITLNHQPQQPQQQTKQSALIRRRSSNESVCSSLTETTPDLQKQRMTDAVIRMGVKHNVEDIVFMLLTLKRKERSLCLFNQNFLREQIKLARSALEIFKDDDEEDGRVDSPPTPVAQSPFPIPITTTSPQTPPLQQRVSRAIPIVAPPPSAQPISTTTDAKLAKIAPENIDQFLVSIQSLPATQQKEKLGDQLFPHVKATGVRHAPKVTVRLLDTIPLSELAHIMYDKVALKTRVDIAVASLRQ
ncbi:hypothetical protein BDC45DRAFT_153467 [Circinella umbellata]|nr:hypothetical protein BDC45DRAFT_153467 [Circinella umbellata]